MTRALTDASPNNPLIYYRYRDNRSTRFSLPPLGSDFAAKLLAGGTLRKQDFPAAHAALDAPTPNVAAAADKLTASASAGPAARSLRGRERRRSIRSKVGSKKFARRLKRTKKNADHPRFLPPLGWSRDTRLMAAAHPLHHSS